VRQLGIYYVLLSGLANGLFSAPMKLIPNWKWENIWFVFIIVSCLIMPVVLTVPAVDNLPAVLAAMPRPAVLFALAFGFAWGFGAILFGLSVDRLGVSLANSLVIGLSSAAGSLTPLIISGRLQWELRQILLIIGVAVFLVGVALCTKAGRMRETRTDVKPSLAGYLFALGSGVMSAIFNVGYSLALPIASQGEAMGLGRFTATNLIWLLMLGAGSIPNMLFCLYLMRRNASARLFGSGPGAKTWGFSALMGLLWGGSIFLYGLATPLLGDLGPAIGWPLSLATGLLVANAMGYWLGEWRGAARPAVRYMQCGIGVLLAAILVCSASTQF
jgi:L-rhamnose-H+ transport protein